MKHLKRLCIGTLVVATGILGAALFILYVRLMIKIWEAGIWQYWKYGIYALILLIVAYLIGLYMTADRT